MSALSKDSKMHVELSTTSDGKFAITVEGFKLEAASWKELQALLEAKVKLLKELANG